MRPSNILLCSLLAGCGSHFDVDVQRADASAVAVRLLPCVLSGPQQRSCSLVAAEDVFSAASGVGDHRKIAFDLAPGTSLVSFDALVCGPGVSLSCTQWDIEVSSDSIDLTFYASDSGGTATGALFTGPTALSFGTCSGSLIVPGGGTISALPPGC
jgi:hypothetical protein